jgi:SAM-dependent methyltransferase
VSASTELDDVGYYLHAKENLRRACADPALLRSTLEDLGTLRIERVLDVGCGIGQALFPLAVLNGALGVGVDVSMLGLRTGRDFFAEQMPDARITFVRAAGESLPFPGDSFDLVNCGLALPYMRNARAIAEIARVLRPGGIFLLKIHHARYYLNRLWHGLTTGSPLAAIHGGRTLIAGTVYHIVGRQPRSKLLNESYQTRWLLQRELARHALVIEREQSRTNPLTPAFVIRKSPAAA